MSTPDIPALSYSSAPGRWVLAITVLGSGMAALDATVVNIALPTIGRDFHAGIASAINNDLARFGGLLAVAVLPALAGITGSVYLHPHALAAGFRTAVLISGGLCAAGGLLVAVTITNPSKAPRPAGVPASEECLYCGLDAPPLISSVSQTTAT